MHLYVINNILLITMNINNDASKHLMNRREEINFFFKVTPANHFEINERIQKLINAGYITLNSWDLEMPGIYFERKMNFNNQNWHLKTNRGLTWVIVWKNQILIKYWGYKHQKTTKKFDKKKILKDIKALRKDEKQWKLEHNDKFSDGCITGYNFCIAQLSMIINPTIEQINKIINNKIITVENTVNKTGKVEWIGYLDALRQIHRIINTTPGGS